MRNSVNKGPKLGLALGSGAAMGMAHIGAIKAFEEEGITFDIITGTSIGSVIGALYAKGYSSSDMLNLFRECDLFNPQSIFYFAIGMLPLEDILYRITGGAFFEDLKKPFKAVAVDVIKGVEEILCVGDLSSALSASCAVPPLRPKERRGKILVDGAFLNAVPADVARGMGANIVLSINLNKGSETNQVIKSALDEIYPHHGIPLANRVHQCYEYSDIVIEPNLSGYSAVSIGGLDEMCQIGYEEAKRRLKDIKNAISSYKKVDL